MSDYSDFSEDGGYSFDDQRDSDASVGSDEEEGNSFEGFVEEEASDADSDASSEEEEDPDAVEPREAGMGANGLFDMEAFESDGDSEGDSDDDTSILSATGSGFEATCTVRAFPRFQLLPAELREMVWQEFCPDLTAASRVFELQLMSPRAGGTADVWDSAVTSQQTHAVRTLLSTCRESRALALAALPHTLPLFRGMSHIRLNLDKDVVFLKATALVSWPSIPGFSEKIKHVVLDSSFVSAGDDTIDDFGEVSENAHNLLMTFPNLETVYCCFTDFDYFTELRPDVTWLEKNELNTYHVSTVEEQPGVGEDLDFMYCWPAQRSLKVVRTLFPQRQRQGGDETEDDDEYEEDAEEYRQARLQAVINRHRVYGHWYLPMLNFQYNDGFHRFNQVMQWKEAGAEPLFLRLGTGARSESDESDDDGQDLEGFIDDDDEEDGEDREEEEDNDEAGGELRHGDDLASDDYDLAISPSHGPGPRLETLFDSEDDSQDSGESEDESEDQHGSDDGSEDGGGSVSHGFADQLADADLPVADLSSPEPDPAGNSDSESSSSETGSPVPIVSRPKHHTIISSDHDDEDDSSDDDDKVVEPQRRAKRRIVSSDSEDDLDSDNAVESRPTKRARVVISDSEDDD